MSVGRLFEQNDSLQKETEWDVNLTYGVFHCSKAFKDRVEGVNLADEFHKQRRSEINVIDDMHHQICSSEITWANDHGVSSSGLAKISAITRPQYDKFYQEEKDKKVKPHWLKGRLYGKTIEPVFFLKIELLDPACKISSQCFDSYDSFNAFIANGCKPCVKEKTNAVILSEAKDLYSVYTDPSSKKSSQDDSILEHLQKCCHPERSEGSL